MAPQDPATQAGAAAPARSARSLVTVAAVVLLAVTAVMVGKFLNGDFKDAEVWYDAGRRVLAGESLAGLPQYRYPPTFAVLVSPLCALGFPAFFFIWYAINVALFGLSLRLSVRLAGEEAAGGDLRAYWLPVVLTAVFAMDNLFLGQTNILVMACVYWALLASFRGRDWLAGLPLGAAIAIKAFPAPLMVYFLYRGRLRTVASTLASIAFFLLLVPAPARGLGRNWREVRAWGQRVVMPYLSRGEAGDWGQHSLDIGNHSVPAVARRLLSRVDASVAVRNDRPLYVNVANLSEPQVNLVVLAVFGALGIGFVAASGWRPPRSREEKAVEYSLAILLVILASALSWTYFFVMLLLPLVTAVRLLRTPRRIGAGAAWALRAALALLVMAVVLLSPSARFTQYVRAAGSLCWATVALFTGLAFARRDLRRAEAAATRGPLSQAQR